MITKQETSTNVAKTTPVAPPAGGPSPAPSKNLPGPKLPV